MVGDLLFDNDLIIASGDLQLTNEATGQHKASLLLIRHGDIRQVPVLGVGLSDFINSDNEEEILVSRIRNCFELDGIKLSRLELIGDNLIEDGVYEEA